MRRTGVYFNSSDNNKQQQQQQWSIYFSFSLLLGPSAASIMVLALACAVFLAGTVLILARKSRDMSARYIRLAGAESPITQWAYAVIFIDYMFYLSEIKHAINENAFTTIPDLSKPKLFQLKQFSFQVRKTVFPLFIQ